MAGGDHDSRTLSAPRYSLSLAAESLRADSLLATEEILKNVVRNSGTSICTGGANTAREWTETQVQGARGRLELDERRAIHSSIKVSEGSFVVFGGGGCGSAWKLAVTPHRPSFHADFCDKLGV